MLLFFIVGADALIRPRDDVGIVPYSLSLRDDYGGSKPPPYTKIYARP